MKNWQLAIIAGVVLALIASVAVLVNIVQSPAIATVNGTKIKQAEVDKEFKRFVQMQPDLFKGKDASKEEEKLRASIVDYLISTELIRQEAEKAKVAAGKKEIADRLAQVKKTFPKPAEFDKALRERNMTLDELETSLADRIIQDKMWQKITGDIKVSDGELKTYYESNKKKFGFEKRPFSEMKAQLKDFVLQEKQRDKFSAWLESIKKEANITNTLVKQEAAK